MSAPVDEQSMLIDKRSRALTMMLLTRRKDLLIEEVKDGIGLDFIVRFHSNGKAGLREFGIQVWGVRPAVTKADADRGLRQTVEQLLRQGPFARPVCLFFFTMEDDGAWSTWVAEPTTSEDGKPLLDPRDMPACRVLDRKALKEIIERVDLWHDSLFAGFTANGPGASKPTRKGTKS